MESKKPESSMFSSSTHLLNEGGDLNIKDTGLPNTVINHLNRFKRLQANGKESVVNQTEMRKIKYSPVMFL